MPPEDFHAQHQLERNGLDAIARKALLKDHASGQNILWATDDYEGLGMDPADHLKFNSPITINAWAQFIGVPCLPDYSLSVSSGTNGEAFAFAASFLVRQAF